MSGADVEVEVVEKQPITAIRFCVHLIPKDEESVQSEMINAETSLTFDECLVILQDKLKKAMNNVEFRAKLEGEPLKKDMLVGDFAKDQASELFVFYEPVKPIKKEQEKALKYETLTKYSFIDDPKFVKVYVPLPGIGQHPAEKIHSRFLDKSFEIKIEGFAGKNYIFAVSKTQCPVHVKTSKVVQKENKLIIYVGKVAETDNWFSLHKAKMVGEKELD